MQCGGRGEAGAVTYTRTNVVRCVLVPLYLKRYLKRVMVLEPQDEGRWPLVYLLAAS